MSTTNPNIEVSAELNLSGLDKNLGYTPRPLELIRLAETKADGTVEVHFFFAHLVDDAKEEKANITRYKMEEVKKTLEKQNPLSTVELTFTQTQLGIAFEDIGKYQEPGYATTIVEKCLVVFEVGRYLDKYNGLTKEVTINAKSTNALEIIKEYLVNIGHMKSYKVPGAKPAFKLKSKADAMANINGGYYQVKTGGTELTENLTIFLPTQFDYVNSAPVPNVTAGVSVGEALASAGIKGSK